jgi:anti-sigma regulatory factor (Ser/Thr protein kinase)
MDRSQSAEFIVLKNTLQDKTSAPTCYQFMDIPCDPARLEEQIMAFGERLEKQFGERAWDIASALDEAVINYADHGHGCKDIAKPEKHIYVQSWHDQHRLYLAVSSDGNAFDPSKVYTTVEERNKHLGPRDRRRFGHIIMLDFADFLAYDPDGRGMLMAFELRGAAPLCSSSDGTSPP